MYDRKFVTSAKNIEDIAPFIYPQKSAFGDQLEQLNTQRENAKNAGAATYETPGEKKTVYPWTKEKHTFVANTMANMKISKTYKYLVEAAVVKYPNADLKQLIQGLVDQGRIKINK